MHDHTVIEYVNIWQSVQGVQRRLVEYMCASIWQSVLVSGGVHVRQHLAECMMNVPLVSAISAPDEQWGWTTTGKQVCLHANTEGNAFCVPLCLLVRARVGRVCASDNDSDDNMIIAQRNYCIVIIIMSKVRQSEDWRCRQVQGRG